MNINNSKDVSVSALWLLFSIAAVSFIFTLNLSHIGEEGVYTISSFEMWYNQHYLYPLLYGGAYGRPPMFNWLIVSLVKVVGWSHMLLAARLVTAAATVGTGLVLAWLVKNVFHDARFAAFSALAYLTTDALLYHGWLAYADPLFAFFVFSAIACLWVACEREFFGLLVIAILSLTAAFLSKALTSYAFYMVAFMLLLFLGKRKFLLHPISIVLHLIALGAPLLWGEITHNANGSSLIHDVWYWGWKSGQGAQIIPYLIQLIVFSIEVFVRILPVSVVAIYYFWRGYDQPEAKHKTAVRFLVLFTVISFFPYWAAVKHSARYVLPLYPFMALCCSYIIWHVGARAMRVALIWFVAAIIIKYVSVIFWWPYYQTSYRGDYVKVAQDVVLRTHDYPLYANDPGSMEHSVFYSVNVLRYPIAPVKNIGLRQSGENDYFIFNTDNNFNSGEITQEYTLGTSGKKLYLLCYGKACS
ncbi:MAG: dolichyl-phosphate-mannose-protein mannosyltransferase family protein [uncultured bacterium]|nr:MAG: dolichyl-phosphate-mannose-protein mannosyltransferase family protein [uncultured bacterium]